MSTSPATPRIVSSHQKLEKPGTDFPSDSAEGTSPDNTSISDSWPVKGYVSAVVSHQACGVLL